MIAIQMSPLAKLFAKIKAEMVANGTPFADSAAEAAFRTWLQAAWLDSGCTQDFLCLSQPASSTTIRLDVRTASAAHRTNVWWGDGTTGSYTTGPSADTALTCTYAAGALRPVVVVGKLTKLYVVSAYSCAFGGRISTARSLTTLTLSGNLLTVSGSITGMPLTSLSLSGNLLTVSGSITGMALTTLTLSGNLLTVSGSITGMALTTLTLSGDLLTVSGSITGMPLMYLYLYGNLLTVSGVPAFAATMRQIYLRPATADLFSQADIDAIWNTAAAIGTTWTAEKLCYTRGNCPARTSASDAAFATLQSRGVACYSN